MKPNRRQLTSIARASLVASLALAVAFLFLDPPVRSLIIAGMLVTLLPVGLVAGRIHRFPAWFTGGLAAVGLLYGAQAVAERAVPIPLVDTVTDWIDLLATLVIILLATFLMSRRRGGLTPGDVLDGLIIASGAWIVSWVVLVDPIIDRTDSSTVAIVSNGLYLPTAVPLIALAAIVAFGTGRPRPAAVSLCAALMCNVVGDVLSALDIVHDLGTWPHIASDVLYVIAGGSCAAAFVHPSAPILVGRDQRDHVAALPARLAAVVVAQSVPIATLVLVAPVGTLDRTVRAVSAFVVLGLVSLRLFTAVRSQIVDRERLAASSRVDELTGLANRRAVLEIARDSIDDTWQSSARPSLYLFDLDGFRNVNDSYGHHAGDDLLVHVARRLEAAASAIGAVASRPSGDEFVVFDPTPTDPVDAFARAHLLHSVFDDAFQTTSGDLVVAASCGVSSMAAGQPVDAGELFRRADIALYRAKATGRNRIVMFDSAMADRVSARLAIERELRGAVDRHEMQLYHQPIINIADGTVDGLEATLRWERPDRTSVLPADFIGVAEETGQMVEIGAWALLEALIHLRSWIDDGVVPTTTTVSVNVSPRQLADPRFVEVVEEALVRSRLPAELLWLEVTENVMELDPELVRSVLHQISETGVRIALDDFGTGASSLSLLRQLPIDRIKIDEAFVGSLADDEHDRTLVRTIIGLGESMGIDIVAEGVETPAQLRMLRSFGCAKAQGFLVSHPVPPDAMRSTIGALEGLASWPEFSNVLGDSPLERSPNPGT